MTLKKNPLLNLPSLLTMSALMLSAVACQDATYELEVENYAADQCVLSNNNGELTSCVNECAIKFANDDECESNAGADFKEIGDQLATDIVNASTYPFTSIAADAVEFVDCVKGYVASSCEERLETIEGLSQEQRDALDLSAGGSNAGCYAGKAWGVTTCTAKTGLNRAKAAFIADYLQIKAGWTLTKFIYEAGEYGVQMAGCGIANVANNVRQELCSGYELDYDGDNARTPLVIGVGDRGYVGCKDTCLKTCAGDAGDACTPSRFAGQWWNQCGRNKNGALGGVCECQGDFIQAPECRKADLGILSDQKSCMLYQCRDGSFQEDESSSCAQQVYAKKFFIVDIEDGEAANGSYRCVPTNGGLPIKDAASNTGVLGGDR